MTADGPEEVEGLLPHAHLALAPDDPDAPTYLRNAAAREVQSQWASKAGGVGARVGLGCGALLGGVSLTLTVYELLFRGRGSGKDVVMAVIFLVAGTPLASLAGAVAFSCLALCLEVPAAAVARRLRRDGPVRVPPRSALAKTDTLGRRPRRRRARGREEGTQRKDGLERCGG
jgi:hypothetical protein